MPTGQKYATNVPQTTLSAPVNGAAASLTVVSSAGWPATPFTAVLDLGNSSQEPVDVSNVSGTTWTVTRSIDGTAAFSHSAGATVTHCDIGRDFSDSRFHIDAVGPTDGATPAHSVHGLTTGVVVGTTEAQTLTNKTLTAPNVNDPVLKVGGNTVTIPSAVDTLVNLAGVQTLTNKTLTAPAISAPVLSGTATGTYTLAGTPTIGSPTLTGTVTGAIANWSGLNTFNAGLTVANGQQATVASNLAKPVVGPQLQAYTPVFSGTGFSLGNGTATGGYVQWGKLTYIEAYLILGTTTVLTTATSVMLMTLPLATFNYSLLEVTYMRGPSSGIFAGRAVAPTNQATTGDTSVGLWLIGNFGAVNPAGGWQTTIDRNDPGSSAATDVIFVKGFYQATS